MQEASTQKSQHLNRQAEIATIVKLVCIGNGEAPPASLDDPAIEGWTFWLEDVPTEHLRPLLSHVRRTKSDGYKILPKDMIAAWNGRYESQDGPPPSGMSWQRDSDGRYTISNYQDENGRWPFDATSADQVRAINKKHREAWEAEQAKKLCKDTPGIQ
jgi:hypothetical protein